MHILFTFYLNGGLHAVSIRKLCERMSKFFGFSKPNPKLILVLRTSLLTTW